MNQDNDSLNSEELERQLEQEMEDMEFVPDENTSVYNPAWGQSHTSFKSMMSGATIMT